MEPQIPPYFLHMKPCSWSQSRSSKSALLSLMRIQCVSRLGLSERHRRKVDVLLSSQYCSDADGSSLDAEYLYSPIQLPGPPLHIETIDTICCLKLSCCLTRQGDHFLWKVLNVSEFYSCQGKCQGKCQMSRKCHGKILSKTMFNGNFTFETLERRPQIGPTRQRLSLNFVCEVATSLPRVM